MHIKLKADYTKPPGQLVLNAQIVQVHVNTSTVTQSKATGLLTFSVYVCAHVNNSDDNVGTHTVYLNESACIVKPQRNCKQVPFESAATPSILYIILSVEWMDNSVGMHYMLVDRNSHQLK